MNRTLVADNQILGKEKLPVSVSFILSGKGYTAVLSITDNDRHPQLTPSVQNLCIQFYLLQKKDIPLDL